MNSEITTEPGPGLPPVQPPTGGLLAQLFLVPGLIVTGVVGLLLFVNWLIGGPRTPESYLKKLDDANAEVRWRAAADLSQVLLRDDKLASDPHFGLALASRLDRARAENARAEQELAAGIGRLSGTDAEQARARLRPGRNYVNYLTACVGNLAVPAGVPVLRQLAQDDSGLEPAALAMRRRSAVWALANLGENMKRFDRLLVSASDSLIPQLAADDGSSSSAAWKRELADYAKARAEGHAHALGVDRTLLDCAQADDPYLRELAAFALNFWTADPAGEAAIEQALVRLSRDNGRGEDLLEKWADEDPNPLESRSVVKTPGYKIVLNATTTLARRGSPEVRITVLEQMLDEPHLRQTFLRRTRDGHESADDATVLNTLVAGLKAVAELSRKRPELVRPSLKSSVERLATHANSSIQHEAKQTLLVLEAGK